MLQVLYVDSSGWFEEPACLIWSRASSDFEPIAAAVKKLLSESVAEIRLSSMPTWDPSSPYDLRMLLSEHDMAVTVDHSNRFMTLALAKNTWDEFLSLVEYFACKPDAYSSPGEAHFEYVPYGCSDSDFQVFISNFDNV